MEHKRVLIVEDDDNDYLQAKLRLEEVGGSIEIVRAKSLAQAEIILGAGSKFDSVILDPGLPDVVDPRYEAYGKLCTLIDHKLITVVTGSVGSEMAQKIQARGSEVLSKDQALQGVALPTAVWGREVLFLLDRMSSIKHTLRDQFEVEVSRQVMPMEVRVDTEMRRMQGQSDRSQHEMTLTLRTLTVAIEDMRKDVDAIKKQVAESAGRTTLRVELIRILGTIGVAAIGAMVSFGTIWVSMHRSDSPPAPIVTPSAPK